MMSRNMRWLLIASVVVIALVVASCATPTPPQAEVECFEDSDCPEGQKCADGECVDCIMASDCCSDHAVEECTEDGNCVVFYCEVSDQCKSICPGDWECVRSKCVPIEEPPPPPEPECTKDEDCCSDYAVEECDEDSNCVAFECDTPEQCKEACPGDWDCVDHVCVPWLGPPSEPGCSVDADCDPDADEECVDGECAEAGPECTDDADCDLLGEGLQCVDGECAEAGPECTENQDCDLLGEGLQCVDGECAEAGPECTDDADCDLLGEGLQCVDGECAEAGPECTENQDCDLLGEGLQCVDGACVEAEPGCTEDADCDVLGEWCNEGVCVKDVDTTVNGSIPPLREGDVLLDSVYVVRGTLADLQHWYLLDPSVLLNTLQQQSVATGSVQDHRISVSGVPPGPHFVVVAWHGPEGGPVYYILVAEFDATGGLVDVHLVWLQGST